MYYVIYLYYVQIGIVWKKVHNLSRAKMSRLCWHSFIQQWKIIS